MEERPPRSAALFIALMLALLVLVYSVAIEPYSINKTRDFFPFFPASSGVGPIRIVFISDIHAAYDSPPYFSKVVEAVNSEKPDLILIGGDIVEGSQSDLAGIGALSKLKSRYGVFAVQGNHDYSSWGCGNWSYAGAERAELESMNITVLSNENRILSINGHQLALVGIDDEWACRSDFEKAASGIPAD
jgi:predicted MPP superfamily phosphohydrolase